MSDGGSNVKDGDELFAETAMQEGLLNESQVNECRRSQERLLKGGQRRTLAEIAAQKTLISQSQADRIGQGVVSDDVPKMAGNYEILRQIGEGGMGRVFKARHVKLGNFAAVKFLPSHLAQDNDFVQRFLREAKLAAQLNSPYSVRTFDVVEVDGLHLILMEYVEGESLDDLLSRDGRLEEKRALRIVHDVASALDEAHETGIIHRDIKPGNILLTRRGVPKLADLGLAKNVDSDQVNLTTIGAILGTPSYMSPEQAMGLPDLDCRSDIFSLGATLYRMVVGDLPFKGETPVNVMHQIATRPLTPPLTLNPALSNDTAAIVCKMMAKDRNDRYQTMTAVMRDINAIIAGEKTGLKYEDTLALIGSGTQFAPVAGPSSMARRGKKTALMVGIAVLVVVLGMSIASFMGREDSSTSIPTTAPGILAKAREAAKGKRWERARSLSRRLLDDFPKAAEAAEAKTLNETASREVILESLLLLAAKGDVVTAVTKLKEAQAKWPDEKRLVELHQTVQARVEKAYGDALAEGGAAEKKGDFGLAVTAYERAMKLRATDEAGDKLKSARTSQLLAQAGKTEDTRERLSAIAEILRKRGDVSTQPVQAKLDELIGVRRKTLTARDEALRFREHMPAAAESAFLLGEEKFTASEKMLASLRPFAMTAGSLGSIIDGLAEGGGKFTSASSSTFDALYPGLERDLAGAEFASGILRLHSAKQKYPDYGRIKELLAKHDPAGTAMAVTAAVVAAKARSSEYASAKEAVASRSKLDAVLGLCEKFGAERKAPEKATALRALVLVRRAAARDAAGEPLGALADAAVAVDSQYSGPECGDVLSAAAAHAVQEMGEALKAGKASGFIAKIGAALGGKEHAAARRSLGLAIGKASFAREFMLDAGLVKAWSTDVGPYEPHGMAAVSAGDYSLGLKYTGLATLAPSSSPEHAVHLGPFFVDVHEVTNEEFQRFVDGGGYANDRWWGEGTVADRKAFTDATGKPGPRLWSNGRFRKGDGKLPVTGVSLFEAAAYARWSGKRLPTEAEWECAALGVPAKERGGMIGKQAFPWGASYMKGNANLRDANVGKPEPVGARKDDRSIAGCFDMVGNVREWTGSVYGPYPGTKSRDKYFGKGMACVRGASFADSHIGASPTTRRAADRAARETGIGFRCAWSRPGE